MKKKTATTKQPKTDYERAAEALQREWRAAGREGTPSEDDVYVYAERQWFTKYKAWVAKAQEEAA